MLSVAFFIVMLNVVMVSVIIVLSVLAPNSGNILAGAF